MNTAIDTIREALESAHHQFQNILDYGVAEGSDRDKVRAEQDILRAALTALKSLEGPRLTVDEAMADKILLAVMGVRMPGGSSGVGHWTGYQIEQLRENLRRVHADFPYPHDITKSANP